MSSFEFPTGQIEHILSQSDEIQMLEFSVYDSRDIACGKRAIFHVEPAGVRDWWKQTTSALNTHDEIGLNSRVQLRGMTCHLPMVDTKGTDTCGIEKFSDFICCECREVLSMSWFASGRSFHGYGSGLLDEVRWRYFMGTLLLFRAEGVALAVDTRWVGHRLRDGFACLRLSWNTAAYEQQPKKLGSWPDLLQSARSINSRIV